MPYKSLDPSGLFLLYAAGYRRGGGSYTWAQTSLIFRYDCEGSSGYAPAVICPNSQSKIGSRNGAVCVCLGRCALKHDPYPFREASRQTVHFLPSLLKLLTMGTMGAMKKHHHKCNIKFKMNLPYFAVLG